MSFALRSSAFRHLGEIPDLYTCEGAERAPPLDWSGPPSGTRSFALIVEDPDVPDPAAPKRIWVHWVLYDLPPKTTSLPENASLPSGAREGMNDDGGIGYSGPCPPVGRHRYFFALYALDEMLGDLESPTKQQLERAMQRHVLGRAELIGTYQRKKKK